jgi:sugar/nucleoside kinase (ribokinase family)
VALDGNLTVALLTTIAGSELFAAADLRIAPASPGKADRLLPFIAAGRGTLYVNLEEAGLLCGQSFDTARDAAQALCAAGAARALVTDGGRPVCDAGPAGVLVKTPPQVAVQRVTGAGDTFMAAHMAAEHGGADTDAALARALEAAATFVSGKSPV